VGIFLFFLMCVGFPLCNLLVAFQVPSIRFFILDPQFGPTLLLLGGFGEPAPLEAQSDFSSLRLFWLRFFSLLGLSSPLFRLSFSIRSTRPPFFPAWPLFFLP